MAFQLEKWKLEHTSDVITLYVCLFLAISAESRRAGHASEVFFTHQQIAERSQQV